jgi:hypothetical protein
MVSPLTSAQRFDAVTAICIVESCVPRLEVFQALGGSLADAAKDHEIVVIANGVSAEVTHQLRTIAEAVANVTVHFLAQPVDRDLAVLLGIDHALGDWVLVLTPTLEEVANLPRVLQQAGPYEIVFAGAAMRTDLPRLYGHMARAYFKLYAFASGSTVDWPTPPIRVYSRAAARYLAGQLNAEFALRSLDVSGAFPGIRQTIDDLPPSEVELLTPLNALRKACRGLVNARAVMMRALIGIALCTGFVAVLSSIYAVLSYLLKERVEPGWTTLSLQISIMMFLFSLMFALLSEYVLVVYRATPRRRTLSFVREMRSPLRPRSERLDVVGTERFILGAPEDTERAIMQGPESKRDVARSGQ